MQPERRSITKACECVIILTVWVAGIIISIPSLAFSRTLTFIYSDREYRTICRLVWPDGPAGHSYYDYLYNLLFRVVTYIIPVSAMAFIYIWLGCILWGNKVIGENTELQNGAIRSKRTVVRLLMVIGMLFSVCWLPYHIHFIYSYYHKEDSVSKYTQHMHLAIHWMAMSNSCYYPIVYYWMNARFRGYFQIVLCLPRKALENIGLIKERPRTPKMATFTCTARPKSCRVLLPHSRVENGPFSTQFMCSSL